MYMFMIARLANQYGKAEQPVRDRWYHVIRVGVDSIVFQFT